MRGTITALVVRRTDLDATGRSKGVKTRRPGRRQALILAVLLLMTFGLVATPASAAVGPALGTTSGGTNRPTTEPSIYPVPQQVQLGRSVRLSGRITVVVGASTDKPAIRALNDMLASIGARVANVETAQGDAAGGRGGTHPPRRNLVIYLGTPQDNPAIPGALSQIGLAGSAALTRTEGYVLGAGRVDGDDALVLAGHDGVGTFYSVQTLRQIVPNGYLAPVTVQDWPLMPIRGAIEGFYGIPWSHQARLDQLVFYGRHKMNTYVYTPKDDRLLRAEWRALYSGEDLDRISELVASANANHVQFTFALSPGNDICYSSQEDFDATIAKFEQLRSLGVSSFYVALDDIPLEFHCAADQERWPDEGNWYWLADSQTYYLNRIQHEWIEPNGLPALQTVPTNYAGSGEDPYKGRFGDFLDDDIRVQWTGEGVFSDTITVDSVVRASHAYRTDHLYIWDNFPVNDGRRDRLFLNPLTGRDQDLYQHIDGFTSNPMIEPYASMPALFNYGDYTWNGPGYDANASMAAALREIAGPSRWAQSALVTFADLNQLWPYRTAVVKAPLLNADIDSYWTAYEAGQYQGTRALRSRLSDIVALPRTMRHLAEPGFTVDAQPWIDAASWWGRALQEQIDMLDAIGRGRGEDATRHMLASLDWIEKTKQATVDDQGADGVLRPDVIVPNVGDDAFDEFSKRALKAYTDFVGAVPPKFETYPATASSSMGTYSSNPVANMVDGDFETKYWSNEPAQTGDWVQVDLGEVREIGSVRVHQSDADNSGGDMIYDAALEHSADGASWTEAGTFETKQLVSYSFTTPVQARYVRLRAVSGNPGGQWVKIREFQVSPPTVRTATNLAPVPGAGPELAFDGDVTTAFRTEATPGSGSYLLREFDDPTPVDHVVVVGTGVGQIQIRQGSTWITVGQMRRTRTYHEVNSSLRDAVTGVRLVFDAGSVPPTIHEVVLGDR